MNKNSDKMDRQGARTVADLELKYNMGKSFAEVMGIADTSRLTAEDLKKVVTRLAENLNSVTASVTAVQKGVDEAKAQLVLAIQYDSEGKPYAVISEKADYIEFNAGQIVIDTDNFKLTPNGSIIATNGSFSGVINSAIIGNGNIQLNNNRIEFYIDDAYRVGLMAAYKSESGAYADGGINLEGNFVFNPNYFSFMLPFNEVAASTPMKAKSGFVKYQVGLTDRYMLFVNGLLMGIYSEIPTNSIYKEIKL